MKKPHHMAVSYSALSVLVVVSACGGGGSGGGGGGGGEPVPLTLAYVLSECHGDAQAATIRQSLQIRQGDQQPTTVVEYSSGRTDRTGAAELAAICGGIGIDRQGPDFARVGVFHRLGVS